MSISALTDLTDIVIALQAGSGTYTDTGGTTPATSDADAVKNWKDETGAHNNCTEATNNPILKLSVLDSKPSVRFDGSKLLNPPSIFGSGYNHAFSWLFIGYDRATSADKPIAFSVSDGACFWMIDRTGWPNIDLNVGNLGTQGGSSEGNTAKFKFPCPAGGPICGGFIYNGTYGICFVNGDFVCELTSGNLGISGAGRIGGYTGGGFGWIGDRFEDAVVNRGITGAELGDLWDYWLSRYPTFGAPGQTLVICEGDSLTQGLRSSNGQTYPVQLKTALGNSYRVGNVGLSGQQLDAMETDAAAQVDTHFRTGKPGVCVLFGGTNDLFFGSSAGTTETRYQTYCTSRQSAGWKVVACTMLPRSDAGTPGGFETSRGTFNTWLRANWHTFADALADLAADGRIGDSGDELDTTYFNADQVHLNSTGYGVIAGLIATQVASLAPAPTANSGFFALMM